MLVRKKQAIWIAQLLTNENGRSPIRKDQIGIRVLRVVERTSVLIAQTVVHGEVGRHSPAVLGKNRSAPRAEIHLRNARLPLLYGGKAKQHAGEAGTRAVVEPEFRRVAGRELVEASVLKETPHGPNVTVKIAAEFHGMPAMLPRVHVANFKHRVPRVHRRRSERI